MSARRIIVIGEGQTEQSFCADLLYPHFLQNGVLIHNPTVKKLAGGIVNWAALKYQVEKHLAEDRTAYVTTLIDFYGIHAHHRYPAWADAARAANKAAAISAIEAGMLADVDPGYQRRFIPYVQLHEFEGLLFSDIRVFEAGFDASEFHDFEYLEETIDRYPNPEEINDGRETAPSKRLARILNGYNKTVHGTLLAHDIGLARIRAKCPRFNAWITKLETI